MRSIIRRLRKCWASIKSRLHVGGDSTTTLPAAQQEEEEEVDVGGNSFRATWTGSTRRTVPSPGHGVPERHETIEMAFTQTYGASNMSRPEAMTVSIRYHTENGETTGTMQEER